MITESILNTTSLYFIFLLSSDQKTSKTLQKALQTE